jgi:hypothetical protein
MKKNLRGSDVTHITPLFSVSFVFFVLQNLNCSKSGIGQTILKLVVKSYSIHTVPVA